MNLETTCGRPPLVLLVDPLVASRHFMWRTLSRVFGIIEAGDAATARAWLASRPDIDALVVQDDLPDERGGALVRALSATRHPIAQRAIVLARKTPDWTVAAEAGLTLVEHGDLRAISAKLASWLLARDAGLARELTREVDRLRA